MGTTKKVASRKPAASKPAAARAPRASAAGDDAKRAMCEALCAILKRQARDLLITQEGPLGMQVSLKQEVRGKPFWLGGVRVGKSYVSYHLMPVYMFPDLLAGLSPALRKRMQGKSCFNFREADPALMRELEALTKAGIARVKKDGAALLAKYGKT